MGHPRATASATASGMSQYGAYGYAQHGSSYKQILHHYYRHTKIGKAKEKRIRVLLTSGLGIGVVHRGQAGLRAQPLPAPKLRVRGERLEGRARERVGQAAAGCGGAGATRGGRSVEISGIGSYRGR